MLIYLATGDVPFVSKSRSLEDQIGRIKRLKNNLTPKEFCLLSNTQYLNDFSENIYNLGFTEKPDYSLLRFFLAKNLMEKDLYPNNDFDWIKKLKSGKFNKLKDQKLRVYMEGVPKIIKLSERIDKLGID
jgi:hypothetical protein